MGTACRSWAKSRPSGVMGFQFSALTMIATSAQSANIWCGSRACMYASARRGRDHVPLSRFSLRFSHNSIQHTENERRKSRRLHRLTSVYYLLSLSHDARGKKKSFPDSGMRVHRRQQGCGREEAREKKKSWVRIHAAERERTVTKIRCTRWSVRTRLP